MIYRYIQKYFYSKTILEYKSQYREGKGLMRDCVSWLLEGVQLVIYCTDGNYIDFLQVLSKRLLDGPVFQMNIFSTWWF